MCPLNPRRSLCPCVLLVPLSLIREREGFAPAVLADLTIDHLAGCRRFEQRAHSAAIKAAWRVLIFSLLPRHFFRCVGLRNTQRKPCRDSAGNRAHELSPRPVYRFFDHAGSSPSATSWPTGESGEPVQPKGFGRRDPRVDRHVRQHGTDRTGELRAVTGARRSND